MPAFTFGIPLIARRAAADWARIQALLDLTLTSILAQTDGDFRVVIAGHDRPASADRDPRIGFLAADWPAQAADGANSDGGAKKHMIRQEVLRRGGGILMFADADDWVDRRLVASARALMGEDAAGAVVTTGWAVDLVRRRAAPLPHRGLFGLGFDRVCGTSTMARLRPGDPDPVRHDPFTLLGDHHRFAETAAAHGLPVVTLPVQGCYLINTAENHSELHGPHAAWRRDFADRVNRLGTPLDEAFLARFGPHYT